MSKRVLIPSVIGAAALGAVAVGGYAMASTDTKPSVENSTVVYTAPTGERAGKLSFTADVSDDSGIREFRVIAWPASSGLEPTKDELRHVDKAKCTNTSSQKARCTYTLKVTRKDAAEIPTGVWHVSVLAQAKDGTTFLPRAATFDVTG